MSRLPRDGTVFLTGATGHLGRAVLRRLALAGTPVCAVGRHRPPALPGVRFLQADLSRPAAHRLSAALRGASVVIHLAAAVPQGTDADPDAQALFTTNVGGSAALASSVPRGAHLVFASTIEVYGRPSARGPLTATSPVAPTTPYGSSKLLAEGTLAAAARARGFGLTVLRLASVYGPGETIDRATTRFLRAAATGGPVALRGSGRERRNPLYVEDAARAVLAAAERRPGGVVPVAGAETVSVRGLAEAAARAAGRDARVVPGSAAAGHDLVLDTSRAERLLGFRPEVGLDAGLWMSAVGMRRAPVAVLDVDGTLFDVSPRYVALHRDLARRHGFLPLGAAAYWRLKRARVPEEAILRRLTRDAAARKRYLRDRQAHIEDRAYLAHDRPLPGAVAALRRLSRVAPVVLLSLRNDARALRWQLRRSGMSPSVARTLTAPAGADPVSAKIALLRSSPGPAALVAGDTEVDGGLAAAYGVPFFAVTSGIRERAALLAARPVAVSRTIDALPRGMRLLRLAL